jgi:hypothetical protein
MNFRITKLKIIISISVAVATFLFFGFAARCFPFGCIIWDVDELIGIFNFSFFPSLIGTYIIYSLFQKSYKK